MSDSDFTTYKQLNLNNLDELQEERETYKLGKVGYAFIDDHFGFRPGFLHVLLARTSAGKTTLIRDIFRRCSYDHKVLWLATEETLDQWKVHFDRSNLPRIENCFFLHEKDLLATIKKDDLVELERSLRRQILETKIKILFFDNITTSIFYNEGSFNQQSEFVYMLKSIAEQEGIPIVIVAHVSASFVSNRLFTSENVRGNKTLSNLAQFWYNMHRFRAEVDGQIASLSFIVREKSRGYPTDVPYHIKYEVGKGFVSDRSINWTEFRRLQKLEGVQELK